MRTVAWGIQGANSHLWLFTKCYWFCLLNTSRSRCLLLIQNTLVFLQACLHDLSCFLTGLLVPVFHATSLVSLKSFSHPAARKTIQKQNTSSCNFLVYNILSPIVFNTLEGYNMLPPEEGLQWLMTGVGPLPNSDGESLCSSNSLPGHTTSFIKWPLLTSSVSPPWLLPCGQRMDFLSPVSPHPHSLLNTKVSLLPKADSLTDFILKFSRALLPGSWTKATLKFWRSFRYLTDHLIIWSFDHSWPRSATHLTKALIQSSSRSGWNWGIDNLPKLLCKKKRDPGQSRERRQQKDQRNGPKKWGRREETESTRGEMAPLPCFLWVWTMLPLGMLTSSLVMWVRGTGWVRRATPQRFFLWGFYTSCSSCCC